MGQQWCAIRQQVRCPRMGRRPVHALDCRSRVESHRVRRGAKPMNQAQAEAFKQWFNKYHYSESHPVRVMAYLAFSQGWKSAEIEIGRKELKSMQAVSYT